MIDEAHAQFLRWATWVKSGSNGINLGYGKNLCQKLLEGKGEFLPGAPRGSGVANNHDPVALKVDKFVKEQCNPTERRILRTFYLEAFLSGEEKAERLKMSRRSLYNQVETLQKRLITPIDTLNQ